MKFYNRTEDGFRTDTAVSFEEKIPRKMIPKPMQFQDGGVAMVRRKMRKALN